MNEVNRIALLSWLVLAMQVLMLAAYAYTGDDTFWLGFVLFGCTFWIVKAVQYATAAILARPLALHVTSEVVHQGHSGE